MRALVLRAICVIAALVASFLVSWGMLAEVVYYVGNFSQAFSGDEVPVRLLVGIVSTAIGCAVAAILWLRMKWFGPRALAVCAASGTIVLVLMVGGAWWFVRSYNSVFSIYDSDCGVVATEDVNARLHMLARVTMPVSARGIHVFSAGGLSPILLLRFTASPYEARQFLERMLSSSRMERCAGVIPSAVLEYKSFRSWWTPQDNISWWYEKVYLDIKFVQVDEESGTVYVMLTAQ